MATTKNSKNKKGLFEKVKKVASKLKKKATSAVCNALCNTKKIKGTKSCYNQKKACYQRISLVLDIPWLTRVEHMI